MRHYEPQLLKVLKARAHDMIDEMVADGVPRGYIYAQLEHRYGFGRGNKHFGMAWSSEQCSKGILALEDIRMKHARRFEDKRKEKLREMKRQENKAIEKARQVANKIKKEQLKPKIVPIAEYKKAMARLKRIRETPRIFRWVWEFFPQ